MKKSGGSSLEDSFNSSFTVDDTQKLSPVPEEQEVQIQGEEKEEEEELLSIETTSHAEPIVAAEEPQGPPVAAASERQFGKEKELQDLQVLVQKPSKEEARPRRGKRVRFVDRRLNLCYDDPWATQRCAEETWYGPQEHRDMRNAVMRLRQQMEWIEQQKIHLQLQSKRQDKEEYSNATALPEDPMKQQDTRSFSQALASLLRVPSEINYELLDASRLLTNGNSKSFLLQDSLAFLYTKYGCIDWIGLEWEVRWMRRDTKERRESMLEIVSDIQSEYEQGSWSLDGRNDELRDCCRNVSQAHALYAQFLAKAQRMASFEQEDKTEGSAVV